MSSARTRRAARRREEESEGVHMNGHAVNGVASTGALQQTRDSGENIFLFVPNVIGSSQHTDNLF